MTWTGGLAEWRDGNTTYLSVAFTWKLGEAYSRALFAQRCGQRVIAGGPALFLPQMQKILEGVAEIGSRHADALQHHNPDATIASRGCPVGCSFCIVPAMDGREFTLLPDFIPRPILCDNNLSALPADYQDMIIEKYRAAGVKLTDANSGFEPLTFDEEVYRRWAPLVNEGRGPWRFAYDELAERTQVHRVMKMLEGENQKRKRVYVLIGNEPYSECMQRIQEVLDAGCEPYVQAMMKLNAMEREPHVRFDWTKQRLKNVERWANRWLWKKGPFEEYDRFYRSNAPRLQYDHQQGLFV